MLSLERTPRGITWRGLTAAAAWLCFGAGAWAADVNAEVTASGTDRDPHPTTYTWRGDTSPVKEPGPYFYSFYYIGTVNADARVGEEITIQRVTVPNTEWAANRKRLVAQLTLFYQLSRNLEPTAMREIDGEPSALDNLGTQLNNFGATPGAPLVPGATGAPGLSMPGPGAPVDPYAQPGYQPNSLTQVPAGYVNPVQPNDINSSANPPGGTPFGAPPPDAGPGSSAFPDPSLNIAPPPGFQNYEVRAPAIASSSFGGFRSGSGDQNFDPRAAAEWTFYYDQYVLWQYYCTRVLLGDMEKALLEGDAVAEQQDGMQPTGLGGGQGDPGINPLTGDPGPGGSSSAGPPGGMDGFINSQTDNFYTRNQNNRAMAGGGANNMDVRQTFIAQLDYSDPERRLSDHRRFLEASQEIENELSETFLKMISRIEERELNQENYEKWLVARREEVVEFANSWSQLQAGEAMVMQDNLYLVTEEPLDSIPINGVNIVRGEQVTPQDLINSDGTLKQPKIE